MLLCRAICSFVLLATCWYSTLSLYHSLPIGSASERRLDSYQFGAIMNSAVRNILAQIKEKGGGREEEEKKKGGEKKEKKKETFLHIFW